MTPPQELVERALAASRADGCVVIADAVSDANLRWANNTLTTNGVTTTSQLTVISVIGGATGVVTRQGVTGGDDLEALVRAAESVAREAEPAEDAAELVGSGGTGEWDAPPAGTSIEVFGRLAGDLGAAFEEASAAGRLLFGYASHTVTSTFVGSSGGLRARHDQPTGYAEVNAKTSDFARSAWAGVGSHDFADVDVPGLVGDLDKRLDWAARSVSLPEGRYETILPPSAVADLMIYLYWSSGARDAHDGRTVFSRAGGGTRVGERLGDAGVSLRSDPGAPGIACSPFVVAHQSSADLSVFDNGVGLAPTVWISGGVLAALVQTRFTAGVTGLPVTPYVDNLIMEGPGGFDTGPGLDAMVAGTSGRALLLTCLWYIREVDPQTLLLTGLTRDGVYLVEGGEVVGAVNNFRFNESPVDLLGRVAEVGRTERTLPREWSDYFTRTAMPPLRVDAFNMSSVSQAS